MVLGELQKKLKEMEKNHGKDAWVFIETKEVEHGFGDMNVPNLLVTYIGTHDNDDLVSSLIYSYDDCVDPETGENTLINLYARRQSQQL